jgi:hypothetical protein
MNRIIAHFPNSNKMKTTTTQDEPFKGSNFKISIIVILVCTIKYSLQQIRV